MADFGLQEHVTADIHQQLPRAECTKAYDREGHGSEIKISFYLSELKFSSLCLTGLVMLALTLSPFTATSQHQGVVSGRASDNPKTYFFFNNSVGPQRP